MLDIASHTDHRRHPRHRVLKEGKIISSITHATVDVTIRDLSVGGARVQIPENTDFPEPFSLLVTSEAILYPAIAKWRNGEMMGVAFVDEPHHTPELNFKKTH